MNKLNVSDLLNKSIADLGISSEQLHSRRSYNIVEFCSKVLKFSNSDTIDFCNKHIGKFDTISIENIELEEGLLSNIGDKIKTFGDRSGMAQPRKETSPNIIGKAGNLLRTDNSVRRNSPMIKVSNKRAGTTDYFSFPNLNLQNPGHYEILQDIIKGKTTGDTTATQVGDADPDRMAALKNKRVSNIDIDLPKSSDQRETFGPALQSLADIIKQEQQRINNNLVVSPQEVGNLKQQANAILDKLTGEASKPAEIAPQDAQKAAAEAIQKTTAAASGNTPQPATNTGASPVANTPTATPTNPKGSFVDAYTNALKPTGTPTEEPSLPINPETLPGAQVTGNSPDMTINQNANGASGKPSSPSTTAPGISQASGVAANTAVANATKQMAQGNGNAASAELGNMYDKLSAEQQQAGKPLIPAPVNSTPNFMPSTNNNAIASTLPASQVAEQPKTSTAPAINIPQKPNPASQVLPKTSPVMAIPTTSFTGNASSIPTTGTSATVNAPSTSTSAYSKPVSAPTTDDGALQNIEGEPQLPSDQQILAPKPNVNLQAPKVAQQSFAKSQPASAPSVKLQAPTIDSQSFIRQQPSTPQVNVKYPTVAPTNPNEPQALTPEEFPDNPNFNASDTAAGDLAGFSNRQNALRKNNDISPEDLPANTAAKQQAQSKLDNYLRARR